MNEIEIIQLLDTYAEFKSKQDLLELDKQSLLDEVKVPEEIQAIIADGNRRSNELKNPTMVQDIEFDRQIADEMSAIVVPEEIKEALAEIDRKRALLKEKKVKHDQERELEWYRLCGDVEKQRLQIQAEVDAKIKAAIDAIAQRKSDIEAEFSGKLEASNKNIADLEKMIREEVKLIKFTVKGQFYRAEYGKPRKSWIPQKLEAYTETHPDIKSCYTEGDPSVALKRI